MKNIRLEQPQATSFHKFLLPAFAAAGVLLLLSQAPNLYQRLTCPFQVQQEEAVNVEFARVLLRGGSLYPDITKGGPYLHPSYPPLFPWLQSKLLGLSKVPFFPGRALALAGFLGCGLLLAYTAWRRWKNPYWTVLLPSLLWLSPTWASWGTMVRLDTLQHLLNMASFLLLWKTIEPFHPEWKQRTEGPIALAGLLNAAAILMKPTSLTVTLAFALYVTLRKMKREAAIFFTCSLVPVAVFMILAQIRTDGMYWTHTVKWAALGFFPQQLSHFLGNGLVPEAGWLVFAMALTLWMKRVSLLLRCQVLFAVLSLWTLSRDGAAENYYMEFIWAGLLLLGEGWAGCKWTSTSPSFERKGWPRVLRSVPGLLLVLGFLSYSRLPIPAFPGLDEMEAKLKMAELYRTEGEHLALDADLPVMAGKRVWYQHSGILAVERAGAWDPEPLLNDIRNKKFSTIELYDRPQQYLVSEKVEKAIQENYKPALHQYGRVWLVPR